MIRLILEFRASPIVTLVFFSLMILTGCGGGDGKQISDTLPEKPATGVAGDGNLQQVYGEHIVSWDADAISI